METEAAIIAFNGQPGAGARPVSAQTAELVARARQGDAEAFDRLLRAHERQVLRTAWRLLGRPEDAQDAAQEVFLRLYRYLDRFDSRQPLSPWLYRVTVNVCRDLGRRRGRRQAFETAEEAGLEVRDPAADPATVAALREETRIVEQGLRTLAEKERAALVLRDVEGLSTAEVAEVLGTSATTVRSHICRARLKIKKFRDRRLRKTLPSPWGSAGGGHDDEL